MQGQELQFVVTTRLVEILTLVVVDGIPINQVESTAGVVFTTTIFPGGISDINPNDVESTIVLKGPNAAALYGSRAGNGNLVTTKRAKALNLELL